MAAKKSLTLIDAILIVSGSMIGSGIFIVSADMSRTVGSPGWMLFLWILSGVITVLGALSYGELAGMFPKAGGNYVYLREAYNPLLAFIYGWTLFLVVQCGTIAAVAVAFAKFSGVLFPAFSEKNILLNLGGFQLTAAQIVGMGSIVFLTWLNSKGIQFGKIIIRVFSSTKIIALIGIILAGFLMSSDPSIWQTNTSNLWATNVPKTDGEAISWQSISGIGLLSALGLGLVGSLFSSDAWNNVTFIAGEIEKPKRNIPLALFIGTTAVCIIYFLANIAYLKLLPFYGNAHGTSALERGIMFSENERVGVAAAHMIFGNAASIIMAVLIIISTFSCNNGIILSSSRLFQAMAVDGLFFKKMKHNNENGVPGFALWVQCIWSAALCLSGQYGTLLDYVMFAVMLFYILTISGIIRLRKKQPETERPYKVIAYPLIPILYIILVSLFCINLLIFKPMTTYPGIFIMLIGIPVYYLTKKTMSNEPHANH
jgi:APA family basic amino acid/polyamine antiporter